MLFPGSPSPPRKSDNPERHTAFVTTARLGIVRPIPIDYGFRPRLRGRLTLRGLTLRRNPWTYGERVSHSLYRYSCQHSHLPYLQPTSRSTFDGLGNAPLPRRLRDTRSFGKAPHGQEFLPSRVAQFHRSSSFPSHHTNVSTLCQPIDTVSLY